MTPFVSVLGLPTTVFPSTSPDKSPDFILTQGGPLLPKKATSIRISSINHQLTLKNFSTVLQTSLDLGCDVQGFSETNFHSSFHNRLLMDQQLSSLDVRARIIWSTSSIQPKKTTFKPGGTALVIFGSIADRIKEHGYDQLGRW